MGILLAPQMIGSMKAYGIKNAALFDGTTGYLSRTAGLPTNYNKWTVSVWVKRNTLSSHQCIFSSDLSGANYQGCFFNINDSIAVQDGVSNLIFTGLRRDTTGWYHVVVSFDNALVGNAKYAVYVNGVALSVASGAISATALWNLSVVFIGQDYSAGSRLAGGLSEMHNIDGQVLTPAAFGKTDVYTGNWIAKKYTGTYGANGFYLGFTNPGNLGEDRSGNVNTWTVTGGVSQVSSTPTNVAALWNYLDKGTNITLSNGNRTMYSPASTAGARGVRSTLRLNLSEKHYFECSGTSASTQQIYCGVATGAWLNDTTSAFSDAFFYDLYYGRRHNFGLSDGIGTYTQYTSGLHVIRFAIDASAKKIWVQVDAAGWLGGGDPSAGTSPTATYTDERDLMFVAQSYGATITAAFEEADWTYAAPTGFLASTTDNLPKVKDSIDNHFKTVLYTGTGANQSITGVGFQPDFIWAKSRTALSHHRLFDACRGMGTINKELSSNNNAPEGASQSCALTPTADGWDFSTTGIWEPNDSTGGNYVAWCASLPHTVLAKTGGTIVPTKEIYNPALGMSIVTYTGNGVAGATVPHSLAKTPAMIIIKHRNGLGSPIVYHASAGLGYLTLDTGNAYGNAATYWTTAPTSTLLNTLTANVEVNALGGTYVAYVFAESDFIKIGSYTGNGSADGPMINAGIKPVWHLNKRADAVYGWDILDSVRDPYNVAKTKLVAHATTAEYAFDTEDMVSQGVKMRTADLGSNAAGGTYLYMMIGQPNGPIENTAR